ncbi:hypothetical protein SLA2020_028730 [Shorea laevis]
MMSSQTKCYEESQDNSHIDEELDYYDVLTDIIELNYHGQFKVVLFHGDWVDPTKGKGVMKDNLGFTLISFNNLINIEKKLIHEPFIFLSQVLNGMLQSKQELRMLLQNLMRWKMRVVINVSLLVFNSWMPILLKMVLQ